MRRRRSRTEPPRGVRFAGRRSPPGPLGHCPPWFGRGRAGAIARRPASGSVRATCLLQKPHRKRALCRCRAIFVFLQTPSTVTRHYAIVCDSVPKSGDFDGAGAQRARGPTAGATRGAGGSKRACRGTGPNFKWQVHWALLQGSTVSSDLMLLQPLLYTGPVGHRQLLLNICWLVVPASSC